MSTETVEMDVFETKNMRRWSRRNQTAKLALRQAQIEKYKGYRERHARCGRKASAYAKWVMAKNVAPNLVGSDYDRPTVESAKDIMDFETRLQKRRVRNDEVSRARYASRRLEKAQNQAEDAGILLEWNFYKHVFGGRRSTVEHVEFQLRIAGFFEQLAETPQLAPRVVTLFNSGWSGRGFNSPHTSQEWIGPAVLAYGGPKGMESALRKIKFRANRILSGFGLSVSRDALRKALETRRRSHKSGKFAAVETLRQILSYRFQLDMQGKNALQIFSMARGIKRALALPLHLRVWMADRIEAGEFVSFTQAESSLPRLVEDNTDGVDIVIDPVNTVVKQGITAMLGYSRSEDPGRRVWLITTGSRSYHHHDRWGARAYYRPNASEAIRQALQAWQQQKKLEREALKQLDLPDNVCLLVSYQDSRDAGNCHEGTFSFMRRIGLQPDVRLRKGLPFCLQFAAGESRLRNAIFQAAKNLKAVLKAQKIK